MEEQSKAITLTIELEESDPVITRTLQIPLTCTFAQLHDIIQTVFGWMDYHMYEFRIPKHSLILEADLDEDLTNCHKPMETKLASEVCLMDVIEPEDTFTYIYDMGDDWKHSITAGKIVTQEEDYPLLISWKEDNACEDAGGMYGYYEKCEILKDQNHPDHEFMMEWMDMQHIEFDPEIVEEELRFIMEDEAQNPFDLDDIEDPLEFLLEALSDVFDLVIEDTLFIIDFSGTTYYVWFHDGDVTRNIRIFESKEDCARVCMDQSEQELINPLFAKCLILEYPDYKDEYEEELAYTYHSFGKEMEFEDILDFTAKLCDLLCPFVFKVEEELDLDYFPDYHEEQMAIHMAVKRDGFVEVNTIDFPMKLEMDKITITEEEQAVIKQGKVNTEALYTSILPIPNLLHDEIEDDFVYAWVMKGKRTESIEIFENKGLTSLNEYLKEQLLTYMKQNGKPKHLYCDDERIRMIFHDLCKTIKLPLDYKRLDPKVGSDLYDMAMEKHNDPELYDPEFLPSVDHLIEHDDQMEEEVIGPILKKTARYLSYINYLSDFDLDDELDDIDLL